jgi:type II secretion system (T2SS) protein G
MAEPAESSGSASPSTQTTCLHCGVEVGRFTSGVKGLCAACSARVLTGSSPAAPPNGKETPLAKHATLPPMTRSRDALAALIANGPSSEAPRMVGELLAADKHLSSYFALVPFVGPLLIQRSEAHTAKEKFWLTWISIGLTSLALLGLVSTLPTPEDRLASLHQRIDREMKVLGDFADRYHTEHGAYPDKAMWRHFAERADPRFYDPWGRPYRYEPSSDDVTIATLGRDGLDGGSDEDADFSAHFRPPPLDSAK